MTLRVGTVTFCTHQGISYLARWFHQAGIITDVAVIAHGRRPDHFEWYPEHVRFGRRPFRGPEVDAFLKRVDVMLFMETPFDFSFFDYCRDRGVRTVVVPMYECWPANPPAMPDKFICPSLLDVEYFPGSPFVQVPVPPGTPWRQRTKALRFLHNGGNLGLRGHKGTREVLQAVRHIKSDLRLTIRAQDTAGLKKLLRETPGVLTDPRVEIVRDNLPYESLFADHDVLVQPEKYNGLSMPLIEARAAGMLVMTSNRFPHNTWLPNGCEMGEHYDPDNTGLCAKCGLPPDTPNPLIPVASYSKARVGGGYQEYDEARIEPEAIAVTMDTWYDRDISEYSLGGKAWAEENSWEKLKPRWLEALAS